MSLADRLVTLVQAVGADIKTLTNNIIFVNNRATSILVYSGGAYPLRPATMAAIIYMGPSQPTGAGTTAGGAGAVDGLDVWFRTP